MTTSKSTRVDIPTLHLFGDQVRRYSYETDINPSGKLNNDVAITLYQGSSMNLSHRSIQR